MRELRARLEAMEETQRRAPDAGDINDEVEVKKLQGKMLSKNAC
jgi:hypothetical protein